VLSIKGEKAKFKAHIEDIEKCGRKTQKDFTHLIRPATSAGGFHDISGSSGSAGMISDDMTRPNSSWKKTKVIKPSEFLQQKQGRKQKDTFWFEKAEKIMKEVENTSKVLDNIDYMWNMVYKLTKEFIPQIKEKNWKFYMYISTYSYWFWIIPLSSFSCVWMICWRIWRKS